MQRNKHLKNVFLRFLKDNNAYFAFISNVEKNNQEGYLKDFFIKYNPERWLSSPFVWERTVQGINFWLNLLKPSKNPTCFSRGSMSTCKWSHAIVNLDNKKQE